MIAVNFTLIKVWAGGVILGISGRKRARSDMDEVSMKARRSHDGCDEIR